MAVNFQKLPCLELVEVELFFIILVVLMLFLTDKIPDIARALEKVHGAIEE